MKIVIGVPPNYDRIVATFGPLPAFTMFAYGDVIYTKQKRQEVDLGLLRHENVHGQQQKRWGGPEKWWDLYLTDPNFRQEMEVEAYRAQVAFYALKLQRKELRQVIRQISKRLAGPMYGHMVTRSQAEELLTRKDWRPGIAALPPVPPVVKLQDPTAIIEAARRERRERDRLRSGSLVSQAIRWLRGRMRRTRARAAGAER